MLAEHGAKTAADDGEASGLARNSEAVWLMGIPARGCQIWCGKALFLAQDQLKTGRNSPVLFTDQLTGGIPMILIRGDL